MFIILASLYIYEAVIRERVQADTIARLEAELESAKNEIAYLKEHGSGKETLDAGNYTDGSYKGTAMGFGGNISVSVEVENGAIVSVDVTDHASEDDSFFEMASEIIPRIISAQTSSVDTVSGATFSSAGIRDAVASALAGAQ
ncbi:MAG: FMN-binding protein [Bacteroidales bacterium]|nr:FMN-binding protein [Bacteroidales bacterium]